MFLVLFGDVYFKIFIISITIIFLAKIEATSPYVENFSERLFPFTLILRFSLQMRGTSSTRTKLRLQLQYFVLRKLILHSESRTRKLIEMHSM
jgi:hypothetical protein